MAKKKKRPRKTSVPLELQFESTSNWDEFNSAASGQAGIYWMCCGKYSVYIGISKKTKSGGIVNRWNNATDGHDQVGKKWPKHAIRSSQIKGFRLKVKTQKNKTPSFHEARIYYWLHQKRVGKVVRISKHPSSMNKLLEAMESMFVYYTAQTRQKGENVKDLADYCECQRKPKKRTLSHPRNGRPKAIHSSQTLINKDKVNRPQEGSKMKEHLVWVSDKFGTGALEIVSGPNDSKKLNGKKLSDLVESLIQTPK